MNKLIKRKDFNKQFLPFNEKRKQIWVINRVKELPVEIVNMAIKLAELDFIHYVRICDETLAASSENEAQRVKIPVTRMNHPTAVGIQILYSPKYKTIDFFDINSPIKGNGSKMVNAVLSDFPRDWQPTVVMDWSNGFWDIMKRRYKHLEWM